MRLSLRILVAFAATFACAFGVSEAALGALGPHAPLSLLLGVPLLLWAVSFTGLKHGLGWARRRGPRTDCTPGWCLARDTHLRRAAPVTSPGSPGSPASCESPG